MFINSESTNKKMTEKNVPKGQRIQQTVEYDKLGRGEYELHVLIQSTSGLSLKQDTSIDAKIQIRALGKTEYTKVKQSLGVEETFWGEHFYFTTQFSSAQQTANQRLIISVYDYNRIMNDTLVGSYQIDLQRIYSEKNHALQHVWLALTNMEKSFTQITGYVKISATLLGEKDKNYELCYQPTTTITKEKKVLVPPEVQRKTYQLTVDIIEGKHIKPADGSSVDSYVSAEFGTVYSKTDVKGKNCYPKFKNRLFLPLSIPANVDNIAFRIYDMNMMLSNELLGSFHLSINEIMKSFEASKKQKMVNRKTVARNITKQFQVGDFQWVNFYGPQLKSSQNLYKNHQQYIPELAPFYIGSILMRIKIEQSLYPKISKQDLLQAEIKNVDKEPPVFYTVAITVTAAQNLYEKNKKYKICLRVGSDQVETPYSVAKNGFCFWNVKITNTISLSRMQLIPDIFVYLVNQSNVKICFKRFKPTTGVILQDQWIMLEPDLGVVKLQRQQAGYLKLKLQLYPSNRKDIVRTQTFNNPLTNIFQKNRRSGRLIIDLLCADSLLPMDDDGSIDAFFVFNFMENQIASSVKNDTLNPIYFERLCINTDIPDSNSCPPIVINAYDKDKLSTQFIGSTFVDVDQAIKNGSLVLHPDVSHPEPQPFWYYLTNNNLKVGKFLIRFRLIPNFTAPITPQINLISKRYDMLLVIMGLRGLKNTGILSVKQPFIQFDFSCFDIVNKNLLTEDLTKVNQTGAKNTKLIRTQPMEKGRSVNINTVIPAKINMPSNYKFWPSLGAKVRDNVLGDVYQPILGYFSINLQNAYNRSQKIKKLFQNKRKVLTNNKDKIIQRPARLEGIDDSLLLSIRNFIIKSLNYNWRTVTSDTEKYLNSVKKNPNSKLNEDFIVLFPTYEKRIVQNRRSSIQTNDQIQYIQKYRDVIQRNGQYMQIGFDDMRTRAASMNTRNKHYRFMLNEPFEKYYQRVNGIGMGVMQEIPIRIGRVFTSKDFVSNMIRKITKEDTEAGIYKGQLFISEYDENKDSQNSQFKKQAMSLLNLLVKKGKVHMFLYIIQAANLPPKDLFGNSDPYLIVKAGKQKLSFQKQFFENEPNPQFLKKIHMVLQFPQDSTVDIQVWDYDPLKADQLIGSVSLDIENRIQSRLTDVTFNNPIQTHNLTHERSKRPQGLIRFWLDLVSVQNQSLYRQFNLSNKAATKFQVRVIVWTVSGMASNDFEDVNDLYVQCNFNGETQQTDTHFRAIGGQGSFNWRMVFKVELPIKNPLLTFRVFDRDLLSKNDYICSGSFSIDQYLREAFDYDTPVILFLGTEDLSKYSEVSTSKKHIIDGVQMYDRFEIELVNRVSPENMSANNKVKKGGNVQVSIEILPGQQANRRPAGKGRQNPNQHPFLPDPKNRLQFSLNPLTMAGRLCGPQFKKKLAFALVCALLLGLAIYFAVAFGGSLVGSLVGTRIAA